MSDEKCSKFHRRYKGVEGMKYRCDEWSLHREIELHLQLTKLLLFTLRISVEFGKRSKRITRRRDV